MVQPQPAPRFSRTTATLTTPPSRAGRARTPARRSTAWGIGDVDGLLDRGVAVQVD